MLAAGPAGAQRVDFQIYGKPPLGAFGIDTLEHIEGAAKMGMTLTFTYDLSLGKKQLDPADPLGQAIAAHRMKVMYNLSSRFNQVRLANDVSATDTVIPVTAEKAGALQSFAEAGYFVIEGERIEYGRRTGAGFEDCRRGAGGTKPAAHGKRLLICNPEALRLDILSVKDSPNLWGYWLADDARDAEADSLKEMTRVIRAADRDAEGRQNAHVIVLGIGGASAMSNYSPGVCDALGVYLYPYRSGSLDPKVRNQIRYITDRARSVEPHIGLIGVYQAFHDTGNAAYRDMPTPQQVREDMLSYYDYGADGSMAFAYHSDGRERGQLGLDAHPEIVAMISSTDSEIVAGKVKRVVPEVGVRDWFSVLVGAEAKPSPGGVPLYDLDNPAKRDALVKSEPAFLAARILRVDGREYPACVTLPAWDRNDPKSARWPIAQIRSTWMATTDWSGFRFLEQPVYNAGDEAIEVWVGIEDADKTEWNPPSIRIPPRVPVLLRVSIGEARLFLSAPDKIARWYFVENSPVSRTEFFVGTPMLIPR